MAIRIAKLAKQLKRSPEEVLEVAASLGLPQTRPADQLSGPAEAQLRQALAAHPVGGRVAAPAAPLREDPPPRRLDDPLADTWMDIALSDDAGFQAALHDKQRDRKLNRPVRHPTKADAQRAAASHERWEDPEPLSASSAPRRPAQPAPRREDKGPDEVLKALGFSGASARRDLAPLLPEEVGALLGQTHLDAAQVQAIEAAIAAHVARCCGDRECSAALQGRGRVVLIIADQSQCDHCHGSNTQRSIQGLIQAFSDRGITRLLVVGGSPNSHDELRALIPSAIKLKLIAGTSRVNRKEARDHLMWSQVAAIWAPTQLDHKVSNLYKGGRTGDGHKPVHVAHRSIEFLAQALVDHLGGDSKS